MSRHAGQLTTGEVADRLGFSSTTIRNWANKGQLQYVTTPSGQRRFYEYEIERFQRAMEGKEPHALPWVRG